MVLERIDETWAVEVYGFIDAKSSKFGLVIGDDNVKSSMCVLAILPVVSKFLST